MEFNMTIFTNDLIDKVSKFSFRYSIEIYDIIGTSKEKEVTKYLTKDKDRWTKELQSIINKNGGSISSIEAQFKRSVKLHCMTNDLSLKSGRFSPIMARHFINAAWKCYGENHSAGGLNRGGPLGISNPERYDFKSICDFLEKDVFFTGDKVKVKTKEKSNQASSNEKETRELLLRRYKDKNEENQKNIKIIEEKTKQNNTLIKRISDLENVIDFNKEEKFSKEEKLEFEPKEKEDKVTIKNKFEYEDNSKHFTLFGGDFEFFDLRKAGFLFILICVLLFLIAYNDYEINNILKLVLSIIKE
jgi:hypothetical protein